MTKDLHIVFYDQFTSEEYIKLINQAKGNKYLLQYGLYEGESNFQDVSLIDTKEYSVVANDLMRNDLPEVIWGYAKSSSFINIKLIFEKIKLWWFLPFSEKSSLRVPIVEKIYQALIYEQLLSDIRFDKVYLYCEDKQINQIFSMVSLSNNVMLKLVGTNKSNQLIPVNYFFKSIFSNIKKSLYFFCSWLLIKVKTRAVKKDVFRGKKDAAILCSLYPAYFEENKPELLKESLFNDFPEELAKKNEAYIYISQNMYGISDILKVDFQELRQKKVVLLDEYLSLMDVVKVMTSFMSIVFVLVWALRKSKNESEYYGIQIDELFKEELLVEALSWSSVFNSLIAMYGINSFLNDNPGVNKVFYTFEYQPRERAILYGVDMTDKKINVFAVQANVMIKNHLNWFFCEDEIHNADNNITAIMPEYLCVYSKKDKDLFSIIEHKSNLKVIGGLRHNSYSKKSPKDINIKLFKKSHGFECFDNVLLLTLSVSKAESLFLLNLVFSVISSISQYFVIVKFHPLNNMSNELFSITSKYGVRDFKVINDDLSKLIAVSNIIVQPSSSVAVISIIMNKMPIILFDNTNFIPFTMRDYLDSAFFIKNATEFKSALNSCYTKDNNYLSKLETWPQLIRDLIDKNDGEASKRLYDFAYQE